MQNRNLLAFPSKYRIFDSHSHFPGILMIKNNQQQHQTIIHLVSLKREKLACVIAAFIDYMPGNTMHVTEMSIDKNNHICFLFVTALRESLENHVPECNKKRARHSALLSSCKQQNSKASLLRESRLKAMVPISKMS